MVWDQIEPTPPHLTYLLLAGFLLSYVLFADFLRNRVHLSEPPIALIVGIILGPRVLGWLSPNTCGVSGCRDTDDFLGGWGWGDDIVQETTRVIVAIQVFAVGVELPKWYASRHWRSVTMLLGPVMSFGWLVCALLVYWIFELDFITSLIVAACLTPTDPVLAASILSNSQFSTRLPKRIKDMLSAESGCNDGVSFPFLYIGLNLMTQPTVGEAVKEWALITILWQCLLGTAIGVTLGIFFNRVLRFSERHRYIDPPGFTVFYLLLAVLCAGIGGTLGVDDFLVAFGAGYGFACDGWFRRKTKETHLPNVIDLLLNSAMFVYLGTIMPWYDFSAAHPILDMLTPWRLLAFLVLVLLLRRIPIVLLLGHFGWIPDIKTTREALFCGHFGPMGLGAIFLAMEARAMLENGTASPDPRPPHFGYPYTDRERAIYAVWPLVCFIVMGSTLVHGLSVLVLAIAAHFGRPRSQRASMLAAETDPLGGMEHEGGNGDSEPSDTDTE